MKRALLLALFGLAAACGGAESPLFDSPQTTTSDPIAADASAEANAPTVLPEEDASPDVAIVVEEDASADVATGMCTGFAAPDTTASCHACTGGSCQANGCFGGFYCKLDALKCVAKPDGC